MVQTLRRLLRTEAPAAIAAPAIESTETTWFEAKRPLHDAVGLPRDFLDDPLELATIDAHLRELFDDPATRAAIEADGLPIPHPDDREGYEPNCHLNYWLSGLADLLAIRSRIPSAAFAEVLDFGGASGRLTRHLAAAPDVRRVTVADLNRNHVQWLDEHFGANVRAVKVSPQPHFPLADGSITLCVGLSVFTHIDVWESGWLAEIHRVLAEGGFAYLTIHAERAWQSMREKPMPTLVDDPQFMQLRLEPMPERIAFDCKPGTRYHVCQTFHSSAYIRRAWGRWFDVVGIYDKPNHFHSVVVLQKRG
jgi:SAM-dependent methyltransferase